MAMAMAIASVSLMEKYFFYFNTAKVFRLGDILALHWHFWPPVGILAHASIVALSSFFFTRRAIKEKGNT